MTAVVLPVLLAAILVVVPARSVAFAQSAVPRSDAVFQVSMLRMTEGGVEATSWGLGGRVTVRAFRWISIDGELTFVPTDDVTLDAIVGRTGDAGLTYRRRRTDGFLGVKVGRQFNRVGLFAKVRPGFSKLTDKGVACAGGECALLLVAAPDYEAEFAWDIGGVVEFYPSRRLLVRIDVANTSIRYSALAPPCTGCTSNNLSLALGFGLRF